MKSTTPPGFARYEPDRAADQGHLIRDKERASGVLEPGKEYKVTGGDLGRFSAFLVLEGIPGSWDSALFDSDLGSLPLKPTYFLTQKPKTSCPPASKSKS